MKLWLDDFRPAPEGWTWVKTAGAAIDILQQRNVYCLSLDHDLGTIATGYTVAKFIEEMACNGFAIPLHIEIHSANPVGRQNMQAAIDSARRFEMNN